MAEENNKDKMEEVKKIDEKKVEEIKTKVAGAAKKELDKAGSEKKEDKKKESKTKTLTKNEAVVNGRDVGISTKHAIAVSDFIRGNNVDVALAKLEEVSKMKRAVPMKGEIPHRKGRIMSGRYPINAVKEFIRLVKNLRANAINHNLELEKFKLFCMTNKATRPQRRFGSRRFKRSHVQLKLIPIEKQGRKK